MNREGTSPVWILGAGRSGQAAAALAQSLGREVRVFDENHGPELSAEDAGADVDWVVSPGFAVDHPWCSQVRAAGGVLIPELEFGAAALRGEVLVITGSLGKTSMVLLAADLLRDLGLTVTVSGNIGTAVSDIALSAPEAQVHVIEASSFQLEVVRQFAPDRAVCLNLFPNHLDRHGDMETYARAKARLFRAMTPQGVAVWPEEYPVEVETPARRVRAEEVNLPSCKGTRFASGPLRKNLKMLLAGLDGVPGLTPKAVEEAVLRFQFPEHRMQEIEVPGVGKVVNDSKSTCFAATRAAVESIPGRLHLIMGGIDKEEDPGIMESCLRDRNPVLYLYGRSGKKMRDAWKDSVDVCLLADSLNDVIVLLEKHRSSREEPIVLSPGCASFDQFDGFEARGNHFQSMIRQLAQSHPL